MKNYHEIGLEIMNGAYDLHTHTEPSAFGRALDDFDLVIEASKYNMAGVMIKSHYEPTQSRAHLTNRKSGATTKAYGGSVLNWPNGGLNTYAVENALKTGASIIWMPTRDAANSLVFGDMPGDFFKRPGITIIDENDKLVKEVYEIFEIMKKYNGYLATGHISTKESIILCEEGRKAGVNMILTHPEFPRTKIDATTQKKLGELGVLIEKCWYNIGEKAVTIEEMAAHIREVGIDKVFLTTDRGQIGHKHPAEEMHNFIIALLEQGFTKDELITMTHTVPALIVNKGK